MRIFRDIISSRNNQTVKWAASLCDKKGRCEAECFLAEGEKLTFDALDRALPITHVFIREDRWEHFLSRLAQYEREIYSECQVIKLSDLAFSKISTEKSPQGIISVIKYLDIFSNLDIIYKEDFFIREDERVLSLCSLRDPSNLGAVIRSAVAFGVEHIVLSSDSADVYNPKTVRAAMGTMFGVRITYVSDFSSFIRAAIENQRRVYTAELRDGAKDVKEIGIRSSDIFIIGNEGHGIPSEISSICTGSVYIPISEGAESLNASVAAAVLMWEQKNR